MHKTYLCSAGYSDEIIDNNTPVKIFIRGTVLAFIKQRHCAVTGHKYANCVVHNGECTKAIIMLITGLTFRTSIAVFRGQQSREVKSHVQLAYSDA